MDVNMNIMNFVLVNGFKTKRDVLFVTRMSSLDDELIIRIKFNLLRSKSIPICDKTTLFIILYFFNHIFANFFNIQLSSIM